MIREDRAVRAPHAHLECPSLRQKSNSKIVVTTKMNRPVVEKTICCLLVIAFSVLVARAQSRVFTIQVESSPTEAEAKSSIEKLQAKGVEAYWVKAEVPGKGTRYRVRIGKYKSQAEAKAKA